MKYLNVKSIGNTGVNFWKCCERSNGQFFILDSNTLSIYDINSGLSEKKNSFADSISDMFYCKERDMVLFSSKNNVFMQTEYNNTIYKTPDCLNLNLLTVTSNKSGNLICAGAETTKSVFEDDDKDSILVFWDIRNPNVPIGYYRESHSDDVISLSFKEDYLLLSGGLDGLINFYDIRQSTESDALVNVFNTEDVVDRCGWLPKNDMIYCFTGSEKQLLWSNQNEDYKLVKNSQNLNSNYKFLTDCIESISNEILTLSLSQDSSEIFVDGPQSHAQICIKNDFIIKANFISNGDCIVAFSDKNIYLCY